METQAQTIVNNKIIIQIIANNLQQILLIKKYTENYQFSNYYCRNANLINKICKLISSGVDIWYKGNWI